MKKFYYKKDNTVDKTPIILERRNTISKDGKDDVENRLSTRTTSLGSVDQLKDATLMPRIQNREITKCLSEDVLSRCYMKNPGKVITERELSASRLYKTRKASINSKDSPQQEPQKDKLSAVTLKDPKFKPAPKDHHKTDSSCLFSQQATQKNDLSPFTLKDPKFKPVPVPQKGLRKRESSCLCYLGIFMAISLSTIGFLAAVTGLLYSEILSDKNLSSHRLQESMIDIINLIENNSSIHEKHVLDNESFARKVSSESVDYDSSEIRKSESNIIESKDINGVQFRQMDMSDLSRLLDSKNAEIKFQDKDTTIFELNTSSSAEKEDNTDNLKDIKEETNDAKIVISETDGSNIKIEHVSDDPNIIKKEKLKETENPPIYDKAGRRENGGAIMNIKQEIRNSTTDIKQTNALHINDLVQETKIPKIDSEKELNGSRTINIMEQEIDNIKVMNKNLENDSSKSIIREDFEVYDKKTEVEEEIHYIDGLLNSQFNALKDSSDVRYNLDLNLSDKKSSDRPEDHSTSSFSGTKLENQSITFTENSDADTLTDKNISKPSVKLNDINFAHQSVTVSLPKDKVIWKAGNPINVSNVDNEPELVDKEISSENLDANANSKTEHDVEAILEVVNEPEDNVQDSFIINRNGDIVVSETSSQGLKQNLNLFKEKSEDGDSSMRTELQSLQKDQMLKETLRIKPLNMKVSLVEAMKHLQTLDVNNKLFTSRMKSSKPKEQREKSSKLGNKQREKENLSVDRMQYLHNLRLALQGNLVGL